MPRSTVGLLAAIGVTLSALVGLVHGHAIPPMMLGAGAATGLAACLALPGKKNQTYCTIRTPRPIA
jgi:hypothetical protein